MPDQLSRAIKRERSQQLHALADRSRSQTLEGAIDGEYQVLIEGRIDDSVDNTPRWAGYTPNYLRIALPATGAGEMENRIVTLRADGLAATGDMLLGALV